MLLLLVYVNLPSCQCYLSLICYPKTYSVFILLLVKFNQIELIGYAAGGDSLFLVYEYAQNGALSDHLHWPSVKGLDCLSILK